MSSTGLKRLPRILAFVIVITLVILAIAQGWKLAASSLAKDGPVCRVDTDRRVVALTLDDGPTDELTSRILTLLRGTDSRATFFIVGENAEASPLLVRRVVADGMEVANHTYSHPNLENLDGQELVDQITKTSSAMEAIDGVPPARLFRAPYGKLPYDSIETIRSLGYEPAHWSIGVDHYVGGLGLTPDQAADSMAQAVFPGSIILAHDAPVLDKDGGGDRDAATEALELLIPELKQKGYAVVSLTSLLSEGAPVAAKPKPWLWQEGYYCSGYQP